MTALCRAISIYVLTQKDYYWWCRKISSSISLWHWPSTIHPRSSAAPPHKPLKQAVMWWKDMNRAKWWPWSNKPFAKLISSVSAAAYSRTVMYLSAANILTSSNHLWIQRGWQSNRVMLAPRRRWQSCQRLKMIVCRARSTTHNAKRPSHTPSMGSRNVAGVQPCRLSSSRITSHQPKTYDDETCWLIEIIWSTTTQFVSKYNTRMTTHLFWVALLYARCRLFSSSVPWAACLCSLPRHERGIRQRGKSFQLIKKE